jgi:hypothetical protein
LLAWASASSTPDALGRVSGWGHIKVVKQQFGPTTTPGDFVWTATPTDKLTFALDSLVNPTTVGTDVAGLMDHFNPSFPYSWPAARWARSYSGPTDVAMLDAVTSFDTSGFLNPVVGAFGWPVGRAGPDALTDVHPDGSLGAGNAGVDGHGGHRLGDVLAPPLGPHVVWRRVIGRDTLRSGGVTAKVLHPDHRDERLCSAHDD